MPENKGKQPDSSFDKWLRSLPHNQTNPFYGVLKNLGREDLLRGQYGEETINSVRPFTYPEDEKLIALSLALRKACKEGRISFGQSDEPDYKTRSIIRSNAELCEKYAIMKDVANLLSSTIKKEPLMLDKTTDTEGKDPILCLKAIRTSTEGETKLYATLLKKGFLTTRTADVETTPDLFTLEQWYKVADLAVKHRHRCGEEQILSTIKDSEKTFDEQYKSFGEMMDRLIRGLVFEVSDTQLLNDFACYPEDNKIWHDIRVEKANIIVKEYTDNNERNFDPKDLKLSEKVRLFEAIKDHIKQALKKE